MSCIIIYQGGDEEILVQLYQDEAETIPVNIDDLDDLQIRFSVADTVIGQWNKTGIAPFKQLERIDPYNYTLTIETDVDTPLGSVDAWGEIITDNPLLTDGALNNITAKKNVYTIETKPY